MFFPLDALTRRVAELGDKNWVLAHKEFLATKYVKRKALKHTKGFFMFFSYIKDHVGI